MRSRFLPLSIVWAVVAVGFAVAGEHTRVTLRDSHCMLMSPGGDAIRVTEGVRAEYRCSVAGNTASCEYFNLDTGTPQGAPTQYEVLPGLVQIWTSTSGNIKLVVDHNTKRFQYGMTAVVGGVQIGNKQCTGDIVRSVD
jgi:hypothetical protein